MHPHDQNDRESKYEWKHFAISAKIQGPFLFLWAQTILTRDHQ